MKYKGRLQPEEREQISLLSLSIKKNMRSLLRNFFTKVFQKKGGIVTYYSIDKNQKIQKYVEEIKSEVDFLLSINEALQLYYLSNSVNKLEGDFAEVGCYQGGSTKLILHSMSNSKHLHLFDTFEGLPERNEIIDNDRFYKGQFACSMEKVSEYLSDPRVIFYKGFFPFTAEKIEKNTRFSFVHLDLDLYEPTIEALKFFYPRLTRGGIILTHDYSTAAGVGMAYNEFSHHHNIPIFPLSGSQAFICKF